MVFPRWMSCEVVAVEAWCKLRGWPWLFSSAFIILSWIVGCARTDAALLLINQPKFPRRSRQLTTSSRPPYLGRHQNGSRGPLSEPDDRRQNQMTVARTRRPPPEPDDRPRTRRPLPEPDDRRQIQTITVRTTSQRTPRTIQSIDRSN